MTPDWETRRIYLFGDAKTIENVAKFMREMQDQKVTYTVANLQALTRIVQLPGDWHDGLDMIQSIYNMYHFVFLDQVQNQLEWKRINQQVRTASRLTEFVHDKLMRFFVHEFVSICGRSARELSLSDNQFICKVATKFRYFWTFRRAVMIVGLQLVLTFWKCLLTFSVRECLPPVWCYYNRVWVQEACPYLASPETKQIRRDISLPEQEFV